MKVLITGGAGYVGTELTRALFQEEQISEITIYDNLSRKQYGLFTSLENAASRATKFLQKDILDTRSLADAIRGKDAVVHLAARLPAPFQVQDMHGFEQINHWGTGEVVRAVEKAGVSRFVFVSSVDVYGYSEEEFTERSRLDPMTAYGVSKMKAEEEVSLLDEKGIATTIIRSARVFGFSPSMRFESVINKFAFDARYHGRIAVHGSGEQTRPFISVQGLVAVLKTALFKTENGIELWNAVEENISIHTLASWMNEMFPDLELLPLCQDLKEGSFRVKPHLAVQRILNPTLDRFKDEVCRLSERFSF